MRPAVLIVVLFLVCGAGRAMGTTFDQLYIFSGGAQGTTPSGLVADAVGNLYGTTYDGGANAQCNNCGTVFELSPPASGQGLWTYTLLYSFAGFSDGTGPEASLAIDPSGNLYGNTRYGGGAAACTYGCGTVFKLQRPATGQTNWTETVLYRFTGGTDGGLPFTPVVLDTFGNLYGTTYQFGDTGAACTSAQPAGCGVVFKLAPPGSGQTSWTQTVIHTFTGSPDGMNPASGLAIDSFGNLFGTTAYGGTNGQGTVFRLARPAPGASVWIESVLFSFNTNGGYFPFDPLTFGPDGLYGTTRAGGLSCTGSTFGCGVVFVLHQPAPGKTAWSEQVLHKFRGGTDGAYPLAGLLFDTNGNLFGTTGFGGGGPCQNAAGFPPGCGTVFQLSPPSVAGGAWGETILYAFQGGTNGEFPEAGLVLDIFGDLASITPPAPSSTIGVGLAYSVRRG